MGKSGMQMMLETLLPPGIDMEKLIATANNVGQIAQSMDGRITRMEEILNAIMLHLIEIHNNTLPVGSASENNPMLEYVMKNMKVTISEGMVNDN